jgi:hypothetical protein
MRSFTVTLSFILSALAVLALFPDSIPAPYADIARVVLPISVAVGAALLFLLVALARPKAAAARPVIVAAPPVAPPAPPAPPVVEAVRVATPAPPANQADAEILGFLAILQEKGRLVDFLMDDVAAYSDAQVGAAARVLHEGCKAALLEHFGIRPVLGQAEGARVTVPTGYAPDDYRLVGKISGDAPFNGVLIHHGWKAEWVKLPRLLRSGGERLPTIAPAEVELG